MEILTSRQMQSVDRRAIDERGIPSLMLMESAGIGVTEALLRDWPDAAARGVCILCGKGNNGGDGLVVARHLARRQIPVEVLILHPEGSLTGDAQTQVVAARASGVSIDFLGRTPRDDPERHDDGGPAFPEAWVRRLDAAGLIVDAMLGTGIQGGARGPVAEAIDLLANCGGAVVSIDLPSGMDADDRNFDGKSVRADVTYTLCRPKPALLEREQGDRVGRLTVIPIGIPPDAVTAEGSRELWIRPADVAALLPRRNRDSHKGTYGHLLVVAGAEGTTGAALLAASAALRSGVGLLTVASSAEALVVIRQTRDEWMTLPLEGWAGAATKRDAVVVGPGLGSDDSVRASIVDGLATLGIPAVVDADGLNAFPGGRGWVQPSSAPGGTGPRVVTPHPGEAARLLGWKTERVQADRVHAVRALAERLGSIVVLKGDRSWVADPTGRIALNTTGNAGMATGGTGDVLAGMIGAFLARGISPWRAAQLGAYLHGAAGDRGASRTGEESLTAGDLIDEISWAIREMQDDGGAEPW